MLFAAFAVSLPIHLVLIVWMASVYLAGPPGAAGPAALTLDVGILQGEQLAEGVEGEDLAVAEEVGPLAEAASGALEAISPDAGTELGSGTGGALDAQGVGEGGLGVSGGGSGGGLGPGGGGGGGASFFGIGGRGTRFAYIVDISGSMANGMRYQVAMEELKRSLTALPDFASFVVYLFSDQCYEPPFQNGYLKAMPSNVVRIKKWIDTTGPMGGTDPTTSFERSLGLQPLPDVIFFLTDGEIPESVPQMLSERNGANGKKRVVIHSVAFSDDAGQGLLRRISRDSEGTFRFVPVGAP